MAPTGLLQQRDCRLLLVPKSYLRRAWPYACTFIYEAMHRTRLGSFKVISELVHDEKACLWLAANHREILGAAVTLIVTNEWRRVCEIVAMGGYMEAVKLIGGIEKYAREQRCSAVRLIGRKGWARVLEGYKPGHVLLEKAL